MSLALFAFRHICNLLLREVCIAGHALSYGPDETQELHSRICSFRADKGNARVYRTIRFAQMKKTYTVLV